LFGIQGTYYFKNVTVSFDWAFTIPFEGYTYTLNQKYMVGVDKIPVLCLETIVSVKRATRKSTVRKDNVKPSATKDLL
jgi:hypothetical protein